MEKVYVIEQEWINDAEYPEERCEMTWIVAVVKDEQKALEMCRRLCEEELARSQADYPNYEYKLLDDHTIPDCVVALEVKTRWNIESGTYFWRCLPYDLIGS